MNNLIVRTQGLGGVCARFTASILFAALTATAALLAGCGGGGGGGGSGDQPASPVRPAAVAPPLGTEQSFAVLAGSTVTNTGSSVIAGNVGVNPGSAVTGFPPGLVAGGTIHAADAQSLQAQNDTVTAYNNLAGQACDVDLTGQDLGGMTLVTGVYCFSSSAQLTGTLTLNAQGNPNAVWVFKTGSTLTTASGSSVLLTNGAQPCNVFWQIGSSATLGTATAFVGNILALTSITLNTGANMSGRALARNGAVTLDTNNVSVTVCGVPPPGTTVPPTLGKVFSPDTINEGGVATLTITLSNANSTIAHLTAQLIDTLPSGMTAVPGSVTSTCLAPQDETPLPMPTAGFSPAWYNETNSTVGLTGGSIPANGSCTVTANVTVAVAGTYVNSLPAGALQTSNGNNAAPAVATLTVIAPTGGGPPTLGKSFSPATINAGGISTLTLTLSNPNSTVADLTAQLIDTLPSGMAAIAGSVTSTCLAPLDETKPLPMPNADFSPAWYNETHSTVGLTGGSIPANGSCTVTANVTVAVAGTYVNSLPAGALRTSNGKNAAPAVATLTVNP